MAPSASATRKPTLQTNDNDVCQSPSETMMATSPMSASASHSQLPKQDSAFLSPPTSPGLLDDNEDEGGDKQPRAGPSSQPFVFPGGSSKQQRAARPTMGPSSAHRQPMLRSASEDVGRSSGPGSSYSQRSTSYAGGTSSNPHSRQASKEYKETLDAKTKDEKDGTRIINQYHLTRVIGQGAYGVVYQGCLRDDPSQVFAVKEFSKTRLNKSRRYDRMRRPPPRKRGGASFSGSVGERQGGAESPQQQQQPSTPRDPLEPIRREIAIMKKLDHPNVISLVEALDDPRRDELYLVVEFCSDGPIISIKLHEQTTPLEEEVAQDYFVQILLGLEFLHENDIIHRDIKPDNVLLCDGGKACKIVDFGVSEMFSPHNGVDARGSEEASQRPKGQGTPAFLSPELCSVNSNSSNRQTNSGTNSYDDDQGGDPDGPSPRELNGRRDDVWALGVTLYCMLVGHLPFDKDNFMDLYEAIRTQDPEYPSHLSRSSENLLRSLLEKDPQKRITTIEAAREHPWVTVEGQQPLVPVARNLEQVVKEVTEEEIKGAICRITSIFTIARAVTKFKRARSRSSMNTSPAQSPKPQQEGGGGGAGGGLVSAIASVVSSPQSSFSLSSPTTTTTGVSSHANTVGSPVQHHRQSRQLLQSHQERRGSGGEGGGSGSGGPLGMLTSALGALSTSGGGEGSQGAQESGEQAGPSSTSGGDNKRTAASPPPTLTEEPEEEAVEAESETTASGSRSAADDEKDDANDHEQSTTQDDNDDDDDKKISASHAGSRPPSHQNDQHEHAASLSSMLSDLEARLERRMRRAWPSGAERFFADHHHHHRESSRERERGKGEAAGEDDDDDAAGRDDDESEERGKARQEQQRRQQQRQQQESNSATSPSSSSSSFFTEATRRLPSWLTGGGGSTTTHPGEASSGVRRSSSTADEGDGDDGHLQVRLFAAEGQPVVRSPGPAPTEVVEDMRRQLGD